MIRQFFSRPTRVSRLYPVFTLALMFASSALVYAWQNNTIVNETAVVDRDQQISVLKNQLTSATSSQQKDQATLQSQTQQINDATNKLADLEKELSSETSTLKSKEAELTQDQTQIQQQENQLSENATQLQDLRSRPPLFSFQNDSSLPDVSTQESEIKQVVTDAYGYFQNLLGAPYLLNKITITFVNQFTVPSASGEIIITNSSQGISEDIHIKNFDINNFQDDNTIIHELGHSFYGIAVLNPSALEEGRNVAATDVVMGEMIADKKLPNFSHLYITISDSDYQLYNQTLRVYADNDSFYNDPEVSLVYQMIGKAWFQLYQQDPNFFKEFTTAYFAKFQKGETVGTAGVQDIIKGIISKVGNQSISDYLSSNRAFNPN